VVFSVLAAGLNGPQISPETAWFDGPASKYYLARAAALAVGSGFLWSSWRHNPVVLRLCAAIVLAAGLSVTVLSGHARADGKVTALVVMAHLVIAGAWLGALPAVLLAVWRGGGEAQTVLSRFSRAAVWLAGGVLLVGSIGAWMLSGGLDTIAQRWGALLIAKVALVVVAILIGGWTRFNVLKDWASRSLREIRVPVVAEVVLFGAIVAASIALTHNGPPDEPQVAGPVELSVNDAAAEVVVSLVIDPGVVGTNDIHLYVTEPSGLPVEVEEATVELSAPDLGIAPPRGPGR
jgi:hypothetical protein